MRRGSRGAMEVGFYQALTQRPSQSVHGASPGCPLIDSLSKAQRNPAYGFANSERANISTKELKALQKLALELLGYSVSEIAAAVKSGALIELVDDDEDEEEEENGDA